jgi:hypothetical protein
MICNSRIIPYYVEGSLPDDGDGTNSSDKKGKQKRQSLNSSIDLKCTKSKRKSREPIKPQEVWVHEDCAAWADEKWPSFLDWDIWFLFSFLFH